ncbi:hypothetical protein [Erwinia phage Kuerle]|nr:hypothetical protein [Erwinia phage Kuerle]
MRGHKMSKVFRANRKASDDDIIRMNSVGLSLSTIAHALGVHPTTITLRLKALGIDPADTRRTFMEDIFVTLSEPQQEWLADQLGPSITIKSFVKNLLVEAYVNRK